LYELRLAHGQEVPNGSQGLRRERNILQAKIEAIKNALSPLLSHELLSDALLRQKGFINEHQQLSLYETGWSSSGVGSQPILDKSASAIQNCKLSQG
jgi:hypothetical protein